MGILEKYEDTSAILALGTTDKNILWSDFIIKISDIIIEEYHTGSLQNYKREWKSAFRTIANQLDFICKRCEDNWEITIGVSLRQKTPISVASSSYKTSFSTSSLNFQEQLISNDKVLLEKIFKNIKIKWILSSGTVVEDVLYEKSKDFVYQHPLHSYIINVSDTTWRTFFSESEVEEIINKSAIQDDFKNALPNDLEMLLEMLISKLNYNVNCESIYNEFDEIKANPVSSSELFWLKRSILDFLILFINKNTLVPSKTEQDLREDIYGFIKKVSKICGTEVETDSTSLSSSKHKNSSRTIGALDRVIHYQSSERADLVFKYDSHEIGCVEIGLEDKGENSTKELNERLIKTPIMMRNFAHHLVTRYDCGPSKLSIAGLIISGLAISGICMTHEVGSVSLVNNTKRYFLPKSLREIPRLLPPVLRLVYNYAQIMKGTIPAIDGIASTPIDLNKEIVYFPPCFFPSDTNKRKFIDVD